MLSQEVNPQVYLPKKKASLSSNQQVFKLNYLQNILEEQSSINKTLTHSVEKVNQSLKRSNDNQQHTLNQMIVKLQDQENFSNQLKEYLIRQEETKKQLLDRISSVEKTSIALMEKLEADSLLTEAILNQQSTHDDALTKISTNLEEQDSVAEQLKKHEELYEDFSKKLEVQELYHTTVMERLDQQEGLIKKVNSEIDNLRAIIFERTSHILEKLEGHFSRITKPIQRYFINTDVKDKEKMEK